MEDIVALFGYSENSSDSSLFDLNDHNTHTFVCNSYAKWIDATRAVT